MFKQAIISRSLCVAGVALSAVLVPNAALGAKPAPMPGDCVKEAKGTNTCTTTVNEYRYDSTESDELCFDNNDATVITGTNSSRERWVEVTVTTTTTFRGHKVISGPTSSSTPTGNVEYRNQQCADPYSERPAVDNLRLTWTRLGTWSPGCTAELYPEGCMGFRWEASNLQPGSDTYLWYGFDGVHRAYSVDPDTDENGMADFNSGFVCAGGVYGPIYLQGTDSEGNTVRSNELEPIC